MFDKLSADVNMMFMSLNERFDELNSNLENRIASKVSQLLDKRVNNELSKIKRDVNNTVDSKFESVKQSIKNELTTDLAVLRDQIESMQSATSTVPEVRETHDRSLNIVIRNMAESNCERTAERVNGLLRDGLKLSHVSVSKADRKKSYNDAKPGVIIATLKSKKDKQAIMSAKPQLRHSTRYTKVFIHHDQSPAERKASLNFATILGALNSDSLSMRGSRVVARKNEHSNERSYSSGSRVTETDAQPFNGDRREDNYRDNHRGDRYADRRDDHRRNGEGRRGEVPSKSQWNVVGNRGTPRGSLNRGQSCSNSRGRR
jgi:hypothetical protein